MANQAIGLAEALGIPFELHYTRQNVPWAFLPPTLWPHKLAMKEDGSSFASPWPDVVMSSGRRSVAPAMAIKKASGGKTFAIHIQDPQTNLKHFDLIIVPEHDRLRGENVWTTRGSLHRISAAKLAQTPPDARFASLPHPLVAVLVGGSTKRQNVPAESFADFAKMLRSMAAKNNASLAITPSRRTGKDNEEILRSTLADTSFWIWDGAGENPYFAMLAAADAIIVTGDSVSMVTEATATGKPVYIYEFYKDKKFQPLFATLYRDGIAKPFTGALESWHYTPRNDTEEVAAKLKPLLLARR